MKGALPVQSNPLTEREPRSSRELTTREWYDFFLRVAGLFDGTGGGIPVADGDYGDITVTVGGTVWTIDPGVVTYAKIQDVSAGSRLLGRGDSGPGSVQEILLGAGLTMTGTTLSAGSGLSPLTPTYIAPGDDTTIAADTQMLFCIVPTVDGTLTVNGTYCEVD